MPWKDTQSSRLRRLFLEGFSVMDIAEPLISFDADADAQTVQEFMVERDFDLVGIRQNGLVNGFVRKENLTEGTCQKHMRLFTPDDDLVPDTANLTDVVKSLAINKQCFVTILDRVGAIVTLNDLEKPPMRMFLFGVITLGEMLMTEIIRHRYSDGSWQELISAQRLAKAKKLQEERCRRGQGASLIDCLQYGDKGWILTYNEDIRTALGQTSRKDARRAIKELEMIRNNLAHTQEIIPTGWQRIVIACSRLEQNLEVITERLNLMKHPKDQE
ncbi:MAG: Swt1 family HEPN domain-containing protein [Desulfuromonadales bacterium]|nr:Swt1 family HEPN domain-containing protein [Desulfuromonadales bacterium]